MNFLDFSCGAEGLDDVSGDGTGDLELVADRSDGDDPHAGDISQDFLVSGFVHVDGVVQLFLDLSGGPLLGLLLGRRHGSLHNGVLCLLGTGTSLFALLVVENTR